MNVEVKKVKQVGSMSNPELFYELIVKEKI